MHCKDFKGVDAIGLREEGWEQKSSSLVLQMQSVFPSQQCDFLEGL